MMPQGQPTLFGKFFPKQVFELIDKIGSIAEIIIFSIL